MILNKVLYGSVTVLDITIAAVILIVAFFVAKTITLYLRRMLREKIKADHLEIISKIVYYGLIVLAMLISLPSLGIKPSGLLMAGGVAGIAIGFASQSIIGNLISGIFLILERPIKIGNTVKIEDTVGFVEDIRIMSTTLRTFDGLFVRIPNQKVFTTNITNYVANVARRFEYTVGIRYSDDADMAIKIIKDIIDNEPFALKYPEPQVFVDNLGDSAVNLTVRIWAPVSKWFGLRTKLLWKIKKKLEAEGVQVPFPQRVIWYADKAEGKNETNDVEENHGAAGTA